MLPLVELALDKRRRVAGRGGWHLCWLGWSFSFGAVGEAAETLRQCTHVDVPRVLSLGVGCRVP